MKDNLKNHNKISFKNIKNGFVSIVKIYIKNNISVYSANTAFFLIITSIPIFMLLFSTLSLLPNVHIETLINYINLVFPNLPYVRTVITYIFSIAQNLATKNIISINVMIAIISASTALYSFFIGIRKIHNVTSKSNYIKLRILAFVNMIIFFIAIILTFIIFILGSMVMTVMSHYFPVTIMIINKIFSYRFFVAFIILFLPIFSIYMTSSNFERKMKHNIIGAIIATNFWLLISNLFSFYFMKFPLNASVYGSLAGIVVVLLWLYVSMNVIFIGAIINEVIFPDIHYKYVSSKNIISKLENKLDSNVEKIENKIRTQKNKINKKSNSNTKSKTSKKSNSNKKSKK